MDRLWTFVINMTGRDWLTAVALLIGLIGAINATLSLRSRFRDWRSTKSKEKYDNRLKEFDLQLYLVSKYRTDDREFRLAVLDKALHITTLTIASWVAFIGAFLIRVSPLGGVGLDIIFGMGALYSVLHALANSLELRLLILRVKSPSGFVTQVKEFVDTGKTKGYIREDDGRVKLLFMEIGKLSE